MAIRANKATKKYESELGIGAPVFINMERELNGSFKEACRGTDVASNNITDRKRADSRYSDDRDGEPLFI